MSWACDSSCVAALDHVHALCLISFVSSLQVEVSICPILPQQSAGRVSSQQLALRRAPESRWFCILAASTAMTRARVPLILHSRAASRAKSPVDRANNQSLIVDYGDDEDVKLSRLSGGVNGCVDADVTAIEHSLLVPCRHAAACVRQQL